MDINSNIPNGWSYFKLNHVDSTNDEVKKLIQQKQSIPMLLLAKKQSKGRGRLNRKWVSLDGNLFFSFAIDFSRLSPETISYLVSVSLINSIDIRTFLYGTKEIPGY